MEFRPYNQTLSTEDDRDDVTKDCFFLPAFVMPFVLGEPCDLASEHLPMALGRLSSLVCMDVGGVGLMAQVMLLV